MAVILSLVASQGKVNAATKSFVSQKLMRLGLEVKSESLNSMTTTLHWAALFPLKSGADQTSEAMSASW